MANFTIQVRHELTPAAIVVVLTKAITAGFSYSGLHTKTKVRAVLREYLAENGMPLIQRRDDLIEENGEDNFTAAVQAAAALLGVDSSAVAEVLASW